MFHSCAPVAVVSVHVRGTVLNSANALFIMREVGPVCSSENWKCLCRTGGITEKG